MLLPILLKTSTMHAATNMGVPAAHLHGSAFERPWTAPVALLVHTLGYLLVAGLIALVLGCLYRKNQQRSSESRKQLTESLYYSAES